VKSRGQTTVMVTHDPRAATIADRILFLADGLIVRELGPPRSRTCSSA
jgi:putative ABC transport system ATP-binding protein